MLSTSHYERMFRVCILMFLMINYWLALPIIAIVVDIVKAKPGWQITQSMQTIFVFVVLAMGLLGLLVYYVVNTPIRNVSFLTCFFTMFLFVPAAFIASNMQSQYWIMSTVILALVLAGIKLMNMRYVERWNEVQERKQKKLLEMKGQLT